MSAFLVGFSQLSAQFNILVGYGLGYQGGSEINTIIDTHNDQNDWYKNKLGTVDFLHGIYFGMRQDWGGIKTVVSYRNSGQSVTADGIQQSGDDPFERTLFFRNNIFSAGLETSFPNINMGASLEYNRFKVKSETSEFSNSYVLQSDHFFGTRLYINLDFHGKGMMGFGIQPYVSLALTDISLSGLSSELGLSSEHSYQPISYGLTFLLVNGPQPD